MRHFWDRLGKSSKVWIFISALVLFGLFQTGGVNGYHRPFQGFKIAERSFSSSPPVIRQFRALGWTLERNFNKGTEEKFYLEYANIFLGRPVDIETFKSHRGNLGPYEELMFPSRMDVPQVPYVDIGVEYPPVNIPFVIVPRLFSDLPLDYFTLFGLQMGVLCFAILLLGLWFGRYHLQMSQKDETTYLKYSTLALLGLSHLFTTRLDIILSLTLLATLIATVRRKPIISGLFLALAAGAKLFPLFLVPIFGAYFWINFSWKDCWRFCLTWTCSTAAIFVPFALLGGERFWVMLWFHGDRPIQVESTYSSLILLGRIFFDNQAEVALFQGSFNVRTVWNTFFQPISTAATILAPIITLIFYTRAARRAESELEGMAILLRSILAFLVLLMVVSKVLSPQYLIWIWPTVFLVRDADSKAVHFLSLLAMVLTQFVYPYFYDMLVAGQSHGVFILVLRNLTLLFLAYLLFKGLWSKNASHETAVVTEAWFSMQRMPLWAYAAMATIALLQLIGKVLLLWPQHVFFDQTSSALGALACNLSQASLGGSLQTVLEIGPLPALGYACLIWIGMDSVAAGLTYQLSSLLLLLALFAVTLRRLGLTLLFTVGLTSLLVAGGLLRSLLYQVSPLPLATFLSLLLFNIIWSHSQNPSKKWVAAGSFVLLLLFLTAPTIMGAGLMALFLYLPIGQSTRERFLGIYSIFLTSSIFFALAFTRTKDLTQFSELSRLPTLDLVLSITAILACAFFFLKRGGNEYGIVRLYFLCTTIATISFIVLMGLEPTRLLELKVCSLLGVGAALVNRTLVRPLELLLPGFVLIHLIAPDPFAKKELPRSIVTRETVRSIHESIELSRPLESDNSFVLSLLGQGTLKVLRDESRGDTYLLSRTADNRKPTMILSRIFPRWKDVPRVGLYLLPAARAVGRQLNTPYRVEIFDPPFAVYNPYDPTDPGSPLI